jgi:hypothetical protein
MASANSLRGFSQRGKWRPKNRLGISAAAPMASAIPVVDISVRGRQVLSASACL